MKKMWECGRQGGVGFFAQLSGEMCGMAQMLGGTTQLQNDKRPHIGDMRAFVLVMAGLIQK